MRGMPGNMPPPPTDGELRDFEIARPRKGVPLPFAPPRRIRMLQHTPQKGTPQLKRSVSLA